MGFKIEEHLGLREVKVIFRMILWLTEGTPTHPGIQEKKRGGVQAV